MILTEADQCNCTIVVKIPIPKIWAKTTILNTDTQALMNYNDGIVIQDADSLNAT